MRGRDAIVHDSHDCIGENVLLLYVYNFIISLAGMNGYCFWNMQVQNPHSIKYNGTIQGLKYIWRTEGIRGMFKGNGTNCARIVPNSAVKFFSYEQASKYVAALNLLPLSPIFF